MGTAQLLRRFNRPTMTMLVERHMQTQPDMCLGPSFHRVVICRPVWHLRAVSRCLELWLSSLTQGETRGDSIVSPDPATDQMQLCQDNEKHFFYVDFPRTKWTANSVLRQQPIEDKVDGEKEF